MARRGKRKRVVEFLDEVVICGVRLRRITLPNGKKVFEEEGVRALLLETTQAPTDADVLLFEKFTEPRVPH